ncbi:uncharacterized protein CELE_ZK616.5 [Caenorhabditis elegans]|uniref:Uncharacterized protein n=1 Tax=Caenorhabditis elegans TaxID=6239 RepID=Q965Z2_CAEEL|nr:Uncharacterized protein CELE_ZK616.5 [Caenorhabditis elegans]CCD71111.1 Uncharacterized protein CELE_ZK616.5 [Caenorhabditis elegans]|eukprot:NP_500800.1 Uncharacterized protein CELE_ZK616.5 [Caenorhabditis elegans]
MPNYRGRHQTRQNWSSKPREEHSPSKGAYRDKIWSGPVSEVARQQTVYDWVTTGAYSLGSPDSWPSYPDEIILMNESRNAQTSRMSRRSATPGPRLSQDRRTRTTAPAVAPIPFQRAQPRVEVERQRIDEPVAQDLIIDDGNGTNNSNDSSICGFVEESEELVYPQWVYYLYPLIPTAPNCNNEKSYKEGGNWYNSP